MPPDDIEFLSPPGAIKPTGPWSLGVRAGDFVFVAGMRGIDPQTNTLVAGDEARIRQAFRNMALIAQRTAPACATRCASWSRHRHGPLPADGEPNPGGILGRRPYPPRTIVEVSRLNQDDIVEVEGTFFVRPTSHCPARD